VIELNEYEIEKNRDRKIDLIYRNLELVSNSYFAAESVFPFWESAFALIEGQILIAYFASMRVHGAELSILGFLFSLIWFVLVSLNLQNALHTEAKAKYLQNMLNEELMSRSTTPCSNFIKPWPSWEDKSKWTLTDIILGKSKNDRLEIELIFRALKSTWLYRRILPFLLTIIWVILYWLAWTDP